MKSSEEIENEEINNLDSFSHYFDEYFFYLGGKADISKYDYFENTPSLSQYHNNAARKFGAVISALLRLRNVNHRIYCDVINSPRLNACAIHYNDELSFVGIDIGSYLRIRHIIGMLLHNLLQEELKIEPVLQPHTDVALMGYVGDFVSKDILPLIEENEDPDVDWKTIGEYRKAKYLNLSPLEGLISGIAFDFFILHEFIHVIQGHSLMAQRELGIKHLWQREMINDSTHFDILQGMETVADFHAGFIMGKYASKISTAVSIYNPGMPINQWLYLCAFAVATTFNIFDISASKIHQYELSDHPHHEVRYLIFINAFASGLSETAPHLLDVWKKAELNGMTDCRTAFERANIGGRAFHNLQPTLPSQWIGARSLAESMNKKVNELITINAKLVSERCKDYVLPVLTGFKN